MITRSPEGSGAPVDSAYMPSRRSGPWRPSRAQLAGAVRRRVPDVIAPGLHVLFCGINPGLYSAAVGHHFARPGNRFWKTLHLAGFTEGLVSPFDDGTLLACGLGITNLCSRTTARAEELDAHELRRGARVLAAKVARFRPRTVAILGVGAYRLGFGRPDAVVGPQAETLGAARLWVLPNPSGLNAHYPIAALAREFGRLHEAALG